MTELKNKQLIMHRKIAEVLQMLNKLQMILEQADYAIEVRDMARQTKVL